MTFQTPNPKAQYNEPAAWVTTGTPVPGSSDPKTVEMLATIAELTKEYGATEIVTVGPVYAQWLLLPDGTVTDDLSLATFEVDWMRAGFEALVDEALTLIHYWGPRMPVGSTWAIPEHRALAIHNAMLSGDPAAITTAKANARLP